MNADRPFTGLREFVWGLEKRLRTVPWTQIPQSDGVVCSYVSDVLSSYLRTALTGQAVPYALWEEAKGGKIAIEPVALFGTDFRPLLVVDVGGLPTLAVEGGIVRPEGNVQERVSRYLGRALIYTRAYPAALAFLLNLGQDDGLKHLFDREFLDQLWSRFKVRIVLRTAG